MESIEGGFFGAEAVEAPEAADFRAEADRLVRRAAAAYFDPAEAQLDHHVRWMRGERRGSGSTSDALVGMAEGLREVLLSWGIAADRLSPGEFPADSFLFGSRRWDFAAVNGGGKPVVLVEFKYGGARHGHGRLRRDVEMLAGMCLDHKLACAGDAPAFRGLVFVVPTFRRAGPLRNESVRRAREGERTRRLETAAGRVVWTGLADAVLALHIDERSFLPLTDSLSPERFLQRLHAFLISLPAETWA